MAIQTLSTIKDWFRTGLRPTQKQFWDTWDSFRHKSEKVQVKDIEGVEELLVELKIIRSEKFLIFKRSFNQNNAIPEPGDVVMGIVEEKFINAIYLGGDMNLLQNFDVINQTEF